MPVLYSNPNFQDQLQTTGSVVNTDPRFQVVIRPRWTVTFCLKCGIVDLVYQIRGHGEQGNGFIIALAEAHDDKFHLINAMEIAFAWCSPKRRRRMSLSLARVAYLDERACPTGSAVGGQIVPGMPVSVVHTAESMNGRACPTMPIGCRVRYDTHGNQYYCEESIV
ncbi:hypothetical protein GWK47_042668 [Chionoecetes opilio]|uniref:Uncharacterized protein n=1 Tax=Chionoecetes opilio TaxID=41210 RepID=A0A8J4Y8Y4_CHIOP|nr:hypothetical protein GWK47_042668 [Chionoecetes opilio]